MHNGEMHCAANVFTETQMLIYLVLNIKYCCFYDIFEYPCDQNGFKY